MQATALISYILADLFLSFSLTARTSDTYERKTRVL
jgi:hypothetical protein